MSSQITINANVIELSAMGIEGFAALSDLKKTATSIKEAMSASQGSFPDELAGFNDDLDALTSQLSSLFSKSAQLLRHVDDIFQVVDEGTASQLESYGGGGL
jgi:hypothetical protein